jgi:DNA polymerase III epsilon subunit-like protein
MDVYVVDIETTGLEGSPKDLVVEIAIMRTNVEKQRINQVYHSLIHYDTNSWDDELRESWIFAKKILSIEQIQNAEKDLSTVIKEVRQILSGKFVTAYNNAFDFDKFLRKDPWNIDKETTKTRVASCIMLTSSEYLRPFGRRRRIYKLEYSINKLLDENTECIIINRDLLTQISDFNAHRANYDAFYAACILLELYKRKQYRIISQIYYAHSMSIYGRKEERLELKLIKKAFPKAKIINPAKYEKKWKKEGYEGKGIMKNCLYLLSDSDIVVFSAIKHEEKYFVGKGVFIEVKSAEEFGMDVYFIDEKLEKNYTLEMYDDTDWAFKFGIVNIKIENKEK